VVGVSQVGQSRRPLDAEHGSRSGVIGITSAGPTLEKRTSGSPKVALSAAIVRSHSITSSQPPPMTCPCTEAITGLLRVLRHHFEIELDT
jgi:hypothetical protein